MESNLVKKLVEDAPAEEMGMAELLAQEEANSGKESLLMAKAISVIKEGVLVDTGKKTEALIPRREFGEKIPFKAGDTIPVMKVSDLRQDGFRTVSWKAARDFLAWQEIERAHLNRVPIRARVLQQIRGGLSLACENGLHGFLPASQVDVRPTHDLKKWKGQEMTVYVIQFDSQKGNLVLSRKLWTQEEQEKKKAELLTVLKVGDIRKGAVRGITSYGAFVDIGGIEGLLHVGELDWSRTKKVSDVLKVGQEIEVKVIKFDPATEKVSLSRKELLPHPWDGIERRFSVGSIVKGRVTHKTDFGAFVAIAPHVEGLVHLSEISWDAETNKPKDLLKVGQEVEVKILSLSRSQEKISLSVKRAQNNPWDTIPSRYPAGSKVTVKVVSFAPYGAFARLPEGPQGLIHISDFSWVKRVENPEAVLKIGQEIEVKVLETDPKNEKISFGVKQLQANPLERIQKKSRVQCKVKEISESGILVDLGSDIEGFIPLSEVSSDRFEKASEILSVGQDVEAVVTLVDPKERKIVCSIKQLENELQRIAQKKYSRQTPGPALGQLFDS